MDKLDYSDYVLTYETGCCCQEFSITEQEFYEFMDEPSIQLGLALLVKCLFRDLKSEDEVTKRFAESCIEDFDRDVMFSSLSISWQFYNKDMLTDKGKDYFFKRAKKIKEITLNDEVENYVSDIHEDVV